MGKTEPRCSTYIPTSEQVIRTLYSLAEGNSKNTSGFVSLFTDDGYFYDVGAGKKYSGPEIGLTVDTYAAASRDMHGELCAVRSFGDHVLAELSLNGTHKGDLVIPSGTISPTGKQIHAPCCGVFHLKDGKVFSFHCYVAVPILPYRRIRSELDSKTGQNIRKCGQDSQRRE
jgi:hypothetical protein